jgi:hypothetical protein
MAYVIAGGLTMRMMTEPEWDARLVVGRPTLLGKAATLHLRYDVASFVPFNSVAIRKCLDSEINGLRSCRPRPVRLAALNVLLNNRVYRVIFKYYGARILILDGVSHCCRWESCQKHWE